MVKSGVRSLLLQRDDREEDCSGVVVITQEVGKKKTLILYWERRDGTLWLLFLALCVPASAQPRLALRCSDRHHAASSSLRICIRMRLEI
jgi:hypothetical protein